MAERGDVEAPEAHSGLALRGSNQSGLRDYNERLVLSLVRTAPMAKAEIARTTGLSAQTVSVMVRRLEQEGLVKRGEPVRGKVGQPSVPMGLSREGAYFFGLKVGRRSIDVVLCDFLGGVCKRASQRHDFPTPEATAAFAVECIQNMLNELSAEQRRRVAGVGIAMPFFLWNWAQALGVPPEQMASWRGYDLKCVLSEAISLPVYLENDASSACAAEVVFGPPETPQDYLYFYLGYFAGGGVVLNGQLFTGGSNSGAVGPMPVPLPTGGMGQLLDVASLCVLERALRDKGYETSNLWTEPTRWDFPEDVRDEWIHHASDGIAHAITAAISIIDFSAVRIDGWLPDAVRDEMVSSVARKLDRADLSGLIQPEILPGTIGPDARAIGAASLPLLNRFLVRGTAL